ncbi:Enolase-phosphatase E1 [Orchesella cincta]|uniref:Enolase-phosphatase E1 n=1 Tax=Orchesella cincta TaxID=48709 RepID=A0A1D2NCI3_ORCCI|nr:Enolase-phosphatase E1 [Orchesella cincta]
MAPNTPRNGTEASCPKVILLDIEGTTTSISFVKDVLFPFARKELETFLSKNWDDPSVQSTIDIIQKQSEDDTKQGLLESEIPSGLNKDVVLPELLKNLYWQMDNDRKTTGLKALQGKIWKSGFEEGLLKGQVYEDVPPAFQRWKESGKDIYIYSSGSVEAQILLFKYSEVGDLTKHLSGYFDTTTGPKIEASSYKIISEKIGVPPNTIMFCTDVSKEAYAAKEAGLQVVVSIRPGNAPLTEQELTDFPNVTNFNSL